MPRHAASRAGSGVHPGAPVQTLVAVLAALSILIGQFFHAGAMRAALALPSLLVLGVAAGIGWRSLGRIGPARWLVAALAAWLWWCARESPDTGLAAAALRMTLGCLVIYLLMANVVTGSRARLLFIGLLVAGALVQTGLGIAQLDGVLKGAPQGWYSEQLRLWYEEGSRGRARGTYLNPNHLCWFLNSTGLLALSLAFAGRLRWPLRWLFALGGLLALVGGALTLSRGGFLGLVVGMAVVTALALRAFAVQGWSLRLAAGLFLAILLPLGALAALGWNRPAVQARLERLLVDSYRLELWKVAWREVEAAPLTGGGPGSFTYYSRLWRKGENHREDYHVHNDWLQSAAEYGIPGALLLLGVALAHARAGWQRFAATLAGMRTGSNRAGLALGGLAAAAFFSLQMGFDFNLQLPANALLAAAVAGLLAPAWRGDTGPGLLSGLAGAALALLLLAGVWGARGEVYGLRAENRLLKGDAAAAYLEARRGLSIDTRQPRLHRLAGEALMRSATQEREPVAALALFRKAEAAFRDAIALAPRDRGHYLRLAEVLLAQRRGDEALQAAHKAISLAPELAQAYELAGQIHEMRGEPGKAMEQYGIALKKTNRGYGARRLKNLRQKQKEARSRTTASDPSPRAVHIQ